jgi:hypothetical protein
VLGTAVASRESDFFRLGGHSLLVLRVAALCRTRLGLALGAEHLAHFEAREVVDPQLGEVLHRRRVSLLQVTELGLREPLGQRRTERELDRGVAVALRSLQLDDATRPGFDHRHRDDTVLVVPDLGHAELAPEDALGRPHYGSLRSAVPLSEHGAAAFLITKKSLLHANAPPG